MKLNPVGWFEIYVEDMNRAKLFYESVFSVMLEKLDTPKRTGCPELEMWSFPMHQDAIGAPGALARMEGVKPGGNSVLIYFSCEDCSIQEQRASDSGGKVVVEKMSIGQWGYISVVLDTEGNTIGLHSRQ